MKIESCDRICAYCEAAEPLFDDDSMLCDKHGVVSRGYTCKHFSYDPLKRIPPRSPDAPKLEYINIDQPEE